VTAAHVVGNESDAEPIMVSFGDGPAVRAAVVAYLPGHEIAVLRPEHPLGATPVELGDDAALAIGDELVACGHPGDRRYATTHGRVSAFERVSDVLTRRDGDADWWRTRDAIQTSVRTRPGYSGGPVATRDGRVIGLTSSGARAASFMIPARHIRTALRWAERANGRTVGPWPAHELSRRFTVQGEDPDERLSLPAHAAETSIVTELRGDDQSAFFETSPDGPTTSNTLSDQELTETHQLPE
jgi:S1-C subfamily serine protease